MSKKQQKLQLLLITIGLLLILVTYFYYPSMKKSELAKDQSLQESLKKQTSDDESTSFENVEYKGLYDFDKPFTIGSEKAYILDEEPDVVYMTGMHVVLHLKDGRVVNIFSTKGRYNKRTYDCFFEEDVRAIEGETNIFADNLDLLATNNAVKIYNRVRLNYPTGSLKADKIDYNFETKSFKVSMFKDDPVKLKLIK